MLSWLFSHQLTSLLSTLLTLAFARSVLDRRRPVGSAFAWLFAIAFLPLFAVPLYLSLGGRKFARRAAEKPRLPRGPNADGSALSELRWLSSGVDAFACFLAEIRGARASIRIVTFVVGNDDTGRLLVEALTERARAGVRVELLIDDFLFRQAPKAALLELAAAGARVERFMKIVRFPLRGRSNLRNHRKIALFDGERAIVGGMNLADEYMGPRPSAARWRDLSVWIRGSAVTRLDAIFRADFAFATRDELPPMPAPTGPMGLPVRVVPSGPDVESDPIYDELLTAIFRADERIWVATPYFVPDDTLVRALEVAARRGVDVRIVVPNRSNHGLADVVAAPVLRMLEARGCKVFRFMPRMIHAKAVLIDDRLAMVGSANFDMRSLWLDYEIALFLPGAAEVDWLASWFREVMSEAAAGAKVSGKLLSGFEQVARLVAPLL